MTRPPGAHLRAPPPGPTPGRLGVRTMLQFPIIVFFMRGILFFDRFYRNRLYLKKNQKRKLYFPFIISASAAPIMVLLKLQLLRFWFDLDEKFWWTHPSIHPPRLQYNLHSLRDKPIWWEDCTVISGSLQECVSHEQWCGFTAPLAHSGTFKRHGSNKLSTLYYPSANSLSVKQHIL